MAKTYVLSFAQAAEHTPANPERTAYRSFSHDVHFREWPSREAMLKTIEMQGRRSSRQDDWHDWSRSNFAKRRGWSPTASDLARRRARRDRTAERGGFSFAGGYIRQAYDAFADDVGVRSARPVLDGVQYQAHGKTYTGPLLMVRASGRGEPTTYFLDRYGNLFFRVRGRIFRMIGNVVDGP